MKDRFTRLAPDGALQVDISGRLVNYIFSDESVGRDGFVVKWDAWQVENFEANPVFLWNHMDEEPPIRKIIHLDLARQLRGAVRFAETEFATTIFALVRDGFLNAVSTSWLPIESEFSSTPGVSRVFTKVDLLEISQVGIGALPSALAARSHHHINLSPLRTWTERALDERAYTTAPRAQLEALYRAASYSTASTSTRAARVARAHEIIEDGQRERWDKAIKIRQRIARHDTGLPPKESTMFKLENLGEAHNHIQRALTHHRRLAGHHGEVSEELNKLRDVHRALKSALADLGIEEKTVSRALHDHGRCILSIRTSFTGAEDEADLAGARVDSAASVISTLVSK